MFLTWWRSLVQSAQGNKNDKRRKRRPVPSRFRTVVSLEQLEDRIVPAAGKANVYLNVSSSLTQSNTIAAARSNVVPVFIDFATISTGSNGGGIGAFQYYVVFDPTVLSISQTGA